MVALGRVLEVADSTLLEGGLENYPLVLELLETLVEVVVS